MKYTDKKWRVPMLGISLAVASALAQGQQSTGGETTLEKITVTGSSIPRADTETPSPVQVITEKELKQSGYTSIAQVLGTITANGQGTLSQGFSGAFAAGAQAVSLRGLNSSATLVLIDGHRVAANPMFDDGQRSFVDISAIPFDAIERVEVLKDGASAQYGSDAMAGVVNIILKKSFVGTTANAEAGYATEGGGATEHWSLTHGEGDLAKDGYSVYGTIEYRHENAITNASRFNKGQWSNLDFTSVGGYNWTPGVPNGARPTPVVPGSVYLYSLAGAATAANTQFLSGPCNSWAKLQAGGCAFAPAGDVQPETKNLNILLSGTKKLGGDWEISTKASLFTTDVNVQANGQGIPPAFPIFENPAVGVNGAIPFVVNYPQNAVSPITIPANYPGNNLGVPAAVIGLDTSGPSVQTQIATRNYRLAFDLTGTLGTWDTATAVTLSRINQYDNNQGTQNAEAMYAALNRAVNPYNILGGNSPTDIGAIYPANTTNMVSQLGSLEFHASHSIGKLDGGDLDLSLGGSYLYTRVASPSPDLYAAGAIPSNTFVQFVNGLQSDTALFAEVVAPVTKQLELDGHARFDHFGYSGQANALTPSFGFKWTATPTVAVRGTLATGFRAPNVAETGKSGLTFASGNDTVKCPNPAAPAINTPVLSCGPTPLYQTGFGGHLNPEKSRSATLGVILEPVKGWSTTFDLFDIKVNDQIYTPPPNVAASPVRSATPIQGLCYGATASQTAPCTINGLLLYNQEGYVNTNDTEVRGFELESSYKWHLGDAGSFTASFDWSHTLSYILNVGGTGYQLAGTHGPELIGGDTGNPKDRIQITGTYNIGKWDITVVEDYISGYSNLDPSYVGTQPASFGLHNTCKDNLQLYSGVQFSGYDIGQSSFPGSYCDTGSFYTTNLTVRYAASKELVLHFAANNLLNKQPPFDANTYGGAPYQYNPSLHFSGAIGRFLQAGVTYSF